jgi:hypothetical protein
MCNGVHIAQIYVVRVEFCGTLFGPFVPFICPLYYRHLFDLLNSILIMCDLARKLPKQLDLTSDPMFFALLFSI